jgi:acyl-CoA thioesterase
MDWLKTARDIFSQDIYATETTGIVIEEAEPGYAVCSLSVDGRHLNANNKVMGGAIFTLADLAFAITCNLDRPLTVSQGSTINYLSAPAGEKVIATGRLVRAGSRTCFCTVDVYDNTGRHVAFFTGNGMVVQMKNGK